MLTIDKLLCDEEVDHVIKQSLKSELPYKLVKSEVRPAVDGLGGFLGDHLKLTLYVQVAGKEHKIYLFMKLIPTDHESKATYINEHKFYVKEAFVLDFIEKVTTSENQYLKDAKQWCSTTYLKNEKLVVMPDLTIEGYTTHAVDETFDIQHSLLASEALARFHVVFTNYIANRTFCEGKSYNAKDEFDSILTESTYIDSTWTRTGAQVHNRFLKEYSNKFKDIELDVVPLYQEAFKMLNFYEDTLNVLVHKDLWASNLMFKYENGIPTNALIIDFQLARYAPPAFDIMIMLYMTTTKSFREQNEEIICQKYYTTFMQNLNENGKEMLSGLNYDWTEFRKWCNKARMMGMVAAMLICQFAIINPKDAEKMFNDKATFDKVMNEERATLLIKYARNNVHYKTFLLELFEEFVERYVQ